MILGNSDSPDLLLIPSVQPREISEPLKTPYTCKNKVLLKENFLSEFDTKSDKDRVLKNLGIYELAGSKWGNIIGNIQDQEDLIAYLDKFKQSENIKYKNSSYPKINNIKEALDYLLYDPLKITFQVSPTLVELNNSTTVYINWGYNKSIISQELNGVDLPLNSRSQVFNNVNTTTTFTLKASDDNKSYQTSSKVEFVPAIYYGNSTEIPSFSSCFKILSKSRKCDISGTFTKYIYILMPTTYGEPRFFVGGFEGGFQKLNQVQYNNISYTIYRSDNSNLGQTTINIQ